MDYLKSSIGVPVKKIDWHNMSTNNDESTAQEDTTTKGSVPSRDIMRSKIGRMFESRRKSQGLA